VKASEGFEKRRKKRRAFREILRGKQDKSDDDDSDTPIISKCK